jgi:multiple antibiotic resistance protein
MNEPQPLLSLGEVFVLLFVMLGPPFKVPAVFAARTRTLEAPAKRKLAFQSVGLAALIAIVGGGLGVFMMGKWKVQPETILLSGGIVFLIVSLRSVLEEYQPPIPKPSAAPPSAIEFAFPTVVTPYGLAAIIVLFANSHTLERTVLIGVFVAIIMGLALLGMLYAGKVMGTIGPLPLRLIGVVLGVMTIALALQMSIVALRGLSIIPVARL